MAWTGALVLLLGFHAEAAGPDAARTADTGDGAGTTTTSDGGGSGGAAAGGAGEITVPEGRTTILRIEPRLGRPIERDPAFLAAAPSYRRALEMDRDQSWDEAAGLYQQALVEVGAAFRLASTSLLEQAATKIEIERRRAQSLMTFVATPVPAQRPRPPESPTRASPLERGRLLRHKFMTVRAGTGAVPAGLVSATLSALGQALLVSDSRASRESADARVSPEGGAAGGDPEIRLLLCATRAAAGDRAGARIELAHVSRSDRLDPARALGLATCTAALGWQDDALESLSVAIYRLGSSPRFALLQLAQIRELHADSDWDILRGDPRFERMFR